MSHISDLLTGKNARERSEIKCQEICKSVSSGEFTMNGIRVDVQSMSSIPGGVQVFARAWRGAKQLGFGGDGSIDVERFCFYNPPVLVSDPAGSIVRESVDRISGARSEHRLREDPAQALRETLVHTIALVGKEDTQIRPGSVGNTTSTFYPDAHPETTTVDGSMYVNNAGTSWGTLRGLTGSVADDTSASDWYARIDSDTTSNQWDIIMRSGFLFDTSAIPDSDSISSATFSLYGVSKVDNLSITPNINVYSFTPASNTALVTGDFANFGTTAYCDTAITYAGFSTSGYNDFVLNATGIAAISKTGVTKLGIRNAAYDAANVAPTWSSGTFSELKGYFADQTGTTNDPKLVVVHGTAAGRPNRMALLGIG